MLMSVPDLRESSFFDMKYVAGNGLILVGCFGSSFYNTYCKGLLRRFQEIEILIFSYITASVASVPLLIWVEPFHWSVFDALRLEILDRVRVSGDLHVRSLDAVLFRRARASGRHRCLGFSLPGSRSSECFWPRFFWVSGWARWPWSAPASFWWPRS